MLSLPQLFTFTLRANGAQGSKSAVTLGHGVLPVPLHFVSPFNASNSLSFPVFGTAFKGLPAFIFASKLRESRGWPLGPETLLVYYGRRGSLTRAVRNADREMNIEERRRRERMMGRILKLSRLDLCSFD